ncbi:MAG: (2Fe-2S) ferredoxin domain-containing protein [Bacteroidales bacterium]
MKKPDYHILVCNSFRVAGDAQGACNRKGAGSLLQYITEGSSDRGLNVTVSATGCLNVCEKGPVVVVHPLNLWYGNVNNEEAIDKILDSIENNTVVAELLISG